MAQDIANDGIICTTLLTVQPIIIEMLHACHSRCVGAQGEGARTMMPSNLAATKARPGSAVASAKVWLWTFSCPSVKSSSLKKPDSEPLPY